MKNLLPLLLAAWILLCPSQLSAQEHDERIGELINQSDWFALDKEFPKVKDKLSVPIIRWLAETMLANSFNRPTDAIAAMDTLLTYHQEELGFDNVSNLIALRSNILGEMGNYAESADAINDFLEQISAFAPKENFPMHIEVGKFYGEIRNEKKPEIYRPAKDTEVPMTIEKAGKGVLMFVPVTIKGKEYKFIFDTGAGSTFVSQRLADEIGLRVVRDSLTIKGVGEAIGKNGTIDSLVVGNTVFRNPIITIAPPNPEVDTVYQVDAVLGGDFMRLVGEVNIYPKDNKIVFPVRKTPLPETGRNMMITSNGLYLESFSNDQRFIMFFDTGNARGDLFETYYQKNKSFVDSHSRRDTISRGGFGGIVKHEVLIIDSIPLRIGNTRFNLKEVLVNFERAYMVQAQEDGALGMDFVRTFRKLIISYDNAFTKVEL